MEIPPELLDVDDAVWWDDRGDLRGHGDASDEVRAAACLLGRIGRHRWAVIAWARRAGWTRERYPGVPDWDRVLSAGVPVRGKRMMEGRAVPYADREWHRALFAVWMR